MATTEWHARQLGPSRVGRASSGQRLSQEGAGYVQLFPTGNATAGASSNLNVSGPGATIANLVIVPVGVNGQITFFNHAGRHLVADLRTALS